MSQTEKKEIEDVLHTLTEKLPGDTSGLTRNLTKAIQSMSEQIGDGLVSVNSARLPDVPLKIVKGTHLTMIRNMLTNSERIPPAIPIIIEQLNRTLEFKNP